jgi:hypothetical protein
MIAKRRPRAAERSWFEEFDEFAAQGFVWRSDLDFSELRARSASVAARTWRCVCLSDATSPTASTRCASCVAGGSSSDPRQASLRLRPGFLVLFGLRAAALNGGGSRGRCPSGAPVRQQCRL